MQGETAFIPIEGEIVTSSEQLTRYEDDLVGAAQVADELSKEDAFAGYHARCAKSTRMAQRESLAHFSLYLAQADVVRTGKDLYCDAEAWRGMSHELLKSFQDSMVKQGYRISTINHRLAIIRQYCHLAHDAGVITAEEHDLIMTVKDYSAKAGRNIDRDRRSAGQPTRILWRRHDQHLDTRDVLIIALFIEHALRVREVASLDIEHVDLERGTITVYDVKTHEATTHKLEQHTRQAAERYLAFEETSRLICSKQG